MTSPDQNPLPPNHDAAAAQASWYPRWTEHGVFTASAERAAEREPFVIVMPPPNVTAVLHVGHGLNNTVQDVLIRWRRMADDEALELLQSMGQDESGLHQLARIGFDTLGLQTYLTAGPKETRAWTIRKGATAPEAAGVIHTDFQRGFIKAEVIGFADLMAAGSVVAARSAGRARMEGKDYVMRDGDVVEFRFNV